MITPLKAALLDIDPTRFDISDLTVWIVVHDYEGGNDAWAFSNNIDALKCCQGIWLQEIKDNEFLEPMDQAAYVEDIDNALASADFDTAESIFVETQSEWYDYIQTVQLIKRTLDLVE